MSVWLDEIPDGYTGQADVSLRGPAEVDGVAVQTDVLQCVPDVVEIFQVAERVLVHHLNIVTLQSEMEEDEITPASILERYFHKQTSNEFEILISNLNCDKF